MGAADLQRASARAWSIVQLMQGSREAVVNYMTPLGLHHLMATSHHYGPGLWVSELARPEVEPILPPCRQRWHRL